MPASAQALPSTPPASGIVLAAGGPTFTRLDPIDPDEARARLLGLETPRQRKAREKREKRRDDARLAANGVLAEREATRALWTKAARMHALCARHTERTAYRPRCRCRHSLLAQPAYAVGGPRALARLGPIPPGRVDAHDRRVLPTELASSVSELADLVPCHATTDRVGRVFARKRPSDTDKLLVFAIRSWLNDAKTEAQQARRTKVPDLSERKWREAQIRRALTRLSSAHLGSQAIVEAVAVRWNALLGNVVHAYEHGTDDDLATAVDDALKFAAEQHDSGFAVRVGDAPDPVTICTDAPLKPTDNELVIALMPLLGRKRVQSGTELRAELARRPLSDFHADVIVEVLRKVQAGNARPLEQIVKTARDTVSKRRKGASGRASDRKWEPLDHRSGIQLDKLDAAITLGPRQRTPVRDTERGDGAAWWPSPLRGSPRRSA